MRIRGAFERADGKVFPNNVSLEGARNILAAAFRGDVPLFHLGLVQGVPSLGMTSADMDEPTIGVHGYARQAVAVGTVDWPTEGVSLNRRYVESKWVTFTAAGGNFDKPIQRIALFGAATYLSSAPIFSLSSPLDSELTITPTTDSVLRTFRYRVYA